VSIELDWSKKLRQFVGEWKRNAQAEKYVGDAPFPNFVVTEQANSWRDFLVWSSELQDCWCFRGQREATWFLHTSLDRAVLREFDAEHSDGIRVTGYYHLDRETESSKKLRQFRERAKRHALDMPADDDTGSWFALMQHYGTPTRFLDWTKSAFIAAYFAFEKEAQEEGRRSAVWAIDLDWLERRGRELLTSEVVKLAGNDEESRARWENSLIEECRDPVIIKVKPSEICDRMAAQRGILLCKLFDEASFSLILMRMMIHPEIPDQPVVRKLEIAASHRAEFLTELRAMGIHRASLFP
jgi:FRG domain